MHCACPEPPALLAFHLGTLPEPSLSQVADHLETCVACDTAVRQFDDQPDPLIAALRRPIPAGSAAGFCDLKPADQDAEQVISLLQPPQRSDEIGRLGGYRILSLLGVGGMGAVFRADDEHLQRGAALKVMLPRMAARPSARQRFLREARAAASLKNQHIVTIYQVSEDQGIPFLAMELLEGESLEAWLQRNPAPELADIVRLGCEIAEGLACAHERGLIHRDIKPANIWLEAGSRDSSASDEPRAGSAKILDFGLALSLDADAHLTQSGAVMGTPHYMPPEQAAGEAVDARSDLFSLGCVLYRMCAGQMPFRGNSTLAVLTALAAQTPRPVRQCNRNIPPSLGNLIMQLLAKNPAQRPGSSQEVVRKLKDIQLELHRAHATRRTMPAKAGPRRWLALAGGPLLLVAAGILCAQIVIRIRDKDGKEQVIHAPKGAQVTVEEGGKATHFGKNAPPNLASPISKWIVLKPIEMKSAQGATLTPLPDNSILASGPNVGEDRYVLSLSLAGVERIAALRIEALTDESLPNKGPGRKTEYAAGMFALRELKVAVQPPTDYNQPPIPLQFADASADCNLVYTIRPTGNWNIEARQGQSRHAIWSLREPVLLKPSCTLTVTMQFGGDSKNAPNLGRFRLAVPE